MRFMFVILFVFLIIENTYARCDFSGKVINVIEVEAKLNNYGLWSLSDKDRIKPWKFRKINKYKKHKKTGD